MYISGSCKKEERNHHTCNQYKITKLEHSSNYKTNFSKTWSFESTYCTSRAQVIFGDLKIILVLAGTLGIKSL